MVITASDERERIWLVSTSSLWVAGFNDLFGDPCGVDAVPVSLAEALSLKGSHTVLIDVSASSIHGRLREVLIQFRQWAPDLRPIVMSHETRNDDSYIEVLIRSGARGFISASASSHEFKVAMENVKEGAIWAPRRVLSRLVQTQTGVASPEHGAQVKSVRFTPREDQVIKMLVIGQCNREIGQSLGIDPGTVKAHLGRIMRKAGVANRIELTMFALKSKQTKHRSNAKPGNIEAI